MIHLHFHFAESSIADWVQAGAAVLGVLGLIITLRQGNKNIEMGNKNFEMQNRALRNSIKPTIFLVPLNFNEDDAVSNIVKLIFQVEKNDAINLMIRFETPSLLSLKRFVDDSNMQDKLVSHAQSVPRVKKGEICTINCVRIKQEKSLLRIITERSEAQIEKDSIKLKLSYEDENGFSYEQDIRSYNGSYFDLKRPIFL